MTAKARGLVNAEVEAIDGARIEPLSYKVAFEIACAAMGGDSQNREEDLVNVNKAMSYPEKVEGLDLMVNYYSLCSAVLCKRKFSTYNLCVHLSEEG